MTLRRSMVAPGVVAAVCIGQACAAGAPPARLADRAREVPATDRRSVTVPMALDHNRVIVEVEFVRTDGSLRTARAWVDTGNQYLIVGEALARDLGLDLSGPREGGTQYAQVWVAQTPRVRLGGMTLDLTGVKTRALIGARAMPGVPAEVNLPASAFAAGVVVFDYPRQRLIVARPGALEVRGVPIPCRVNPATGLFLVTATLDGEQVQLGVDTGSSGTWVTETLTAAWRARHADWPVATGAVGSTNFFGFPFETQGTLMRLPEVRIAGLACRDVALLGLPQGLFDWYSAKSAGPVAGFLGGNVLRGFRLMVDVPGRMTHWEAGQAPDPGDLDLVGLTLRPEVSGAYVIAGVTARDGAPSVVGLEPGDRLLGVDGRAIAGASMGTVVSALRGAPGSVRTLSIDRDGARLTVEAKVGRFP